MEGRKEQQTELGAEMLTKYIGNSKRTRLVVALAAMAIIALSGPLGLSTTAIGLIGGIAAAYVAGETARPSNKAKGGK